MNKLIVNYEVIYKKKGHINVFYDLGVKVFFKKIPKMQVI